MTFGSILYTLLIEPLQLFFEVIFVVAQRFTNHAGLSIIVLSLIMNFLVLPLYKRADAMQAEERDTEAKLHKGVAHIKKAFSGDERMMILQTYYRQNHYRPTDAFKGSVSLFLEIPFFIAAYQFLSHLETLQGVSFGPIADLSVSDGLLVIAGVTINVLPLLMTAINLISCIIYTKGFPMKTKVQLYAMAIFFLWFLYDSPSGLLFYWTLNNLFSLVKNIFYKLKHPGFVLSILSALTGAALSIYGGFFSTNLFTNNVFLVIAGICLMLPLVWHYIKAQDPAFLHHEQKESIPHPKMFIAAALLLSLILGVLIPSAVLKSSPQEFVDLNNFHNPLWYVVSCFCIAAGLFLIWFGVFYWLFNKKGKVVFEKTMWTLCGVALVNYMFFGTALGTLTTSLTYENGLSFGTADILINAALLIGLCVIMVVVFTRWPKFTSGAMATGIIAVSGMSFFNLTDINTSISAIKENQEETESTTPQFTLSKTGQNVVVIMLDRAIGPYVPYIFNENPELQEEFDGFTYYSNTVSYGWHTNFASGALYGGYDYTPEEINKRSDESLEDKQNEALKVMPVLFDENDYDVTVCDPSYAGYQWIPDLSIYDDYPDIHTYNTMGKFNETTDKDTVYNNNLRNFFCYSLMKSSPLGIQSFLYDDGDYIQATKSDQYSNQTTSGTSTAEGIDATFMNSYNVLKNLDTMTDITDEETGSFLMMANETTHAQVLLQEPSYEPTLYVDNTEYDELHSSRFTVNGKTMKMTETSQYQHYEMNTAAFMQIGNWLEYLKEEGVYDNTRIILVSDHGFTLDQFDELSLTNDDGTTEDLEAYAPLLMVKDFNSTGFTTSDEFMTNADVPTIATSGVIDDPTNPFTGNAINSDAKSSQEQYIIASNDYDIADNCGNVFNPSDWYSVHDDLWNTDNWKKTASNSTSPTGE